MKNQDFGFDKENILAVNISKLQNPAEINELKTKIKWTNGVVDVAGSSKIPLSHKDDFSCFLDDEKTGKKKFAAIIYIDEDYFDLLGMEATQRVHQGNMEDQINYGMYVNEVFIAEYGDQYALGDPVEIYERASSNESTFTASIIGILKNYKLRVLQPSIDPAIFKVDKSELNHLLVKLSPGTQHDAISSIESTFKKQYPNLAFEFTFVDDEMDLMFGMINPFSKLVYYATFFAIFIASMGLFALSLFVTQQRTKEIGIRKIFGSSELNIALLLANQFIKLIVISFIIAGPLTFYGFRWILMKFPEKIVLSWSLLFGAAIAFILIALLTVIGQSWKAAKTNPVDTLRYE